MGHALVSYFWSGSLTVILAPVTAGCCDSSFVGGWAAGRVPGPDMAGKILKNWFGVIWDHFYGFCDNLQLDHPHDPCDDMPKIVKML